MIRTYTSLITASVLAFGATSAFGQSQTDSPRQGQSQSQSDSPRQSQNQSDSQRQGQSQSQSDSHRQNLQIAEHLMQQRSGLYSAIAIAETHTKGVAIGVRLTRNHGLTTSQDRQTDQQQERPAGQDRQPGQQPTRAADQDRQPGQQPTRPADQDRTAGQQPTRAADQDRTAAGQQPTRTADQQSAKSGSLFAIVTCVVDRTRVREVVIDMDTNTIIGVQTASLRDNNHGDRNYDRDYDRDSDSSTGAASGYARASDLMNATVRNNADKKLGDIDELAIDPDSNRVVYGVLRRGGFLGMGESRYAIASSELTPLHNGRIVLDLDENRFDNISGFDNKNWPTQAEAKLSSARSTQATSAPAARRVVKASNIIGENVQCRDGHKVGEISDLVVEASSGRVLYAIVKADRGHMPVPMALLRKTENHYTLPMPMDQLRSMPMLDTDRDPNWSDESWNRRIHENFGAKFELASARDGSR
jgi:sporulation protein YlmC with PRC-barrel domain